MIRGLRGYVLLLCDWGGLASAPDIARGDLDAVEELPSTPRIDLGRSNGAEDLAERKRDGAAIFHYREFERPIRDSTLALRGATPGGMEVAIGHAAEGNRVTLGSAGHDMTTLWTHTPPSPPSYKSANKLIFFNDLRSGCRGKYLILPGLIAEF